MELLRGGDVMLGSSLEGIGEHYINPAIVLTGVILDPSLDLTTGEYEVLRVSFGDYCADHRIISQSIFTRPVAAASTFSTCFAVGGFSFLFLTTILNCGNCRALGMGVLSMYPMPTSRKRSHR